MDGRTRFLAEIAKERGRLVAKDRFAPDAPTVPLAPPRGTPGAPVGSFVTVHVSKGRARAEGEPLALAGSALASLIRIAAEHGLDPIFPDPVRDEVRSILGDEPSQPPGTDDPRLLDCTALPFVTIDNADSRDLDQALYIERDGEGHRVMYALADAAHYVRPGTALFEEALHRSASFYFPGWMIPMLPRDLSEDLVSLNPLVLRRALMFDMRLDESGRKVETKVYRARIRSAAKLTYDGVQEFLDRDPKHRFAKEPYAQSLRLLRVVGEKRIRDAASRDVVHHRRRTVEVGMKERSSFVIFSGLRNAVERYNEQISLMCNTEGALLLRAGESRPQVQAVYRVHPSPPADRVGAFARMVETLRRLHHKEADPRFEWKRDEGESLASFLDKLPHDDADGGRISRALERQAILMNVRSTFSSEAAEHHGVGADVYARFSSPMREIVGVFLHKELIESLEGGEDGSTSDAANRADDELRERVIAAANRAKNVQRRITALSNRLALDQLFETDLAAKKRPVRVGTVMGVDGSKVHVALDEPAVDVKLYRVDLEQHYETKLRPGPRECSLRSRDGRELFRVGTQVELSVTGRDDKRDRWVLTPTR